MCGIIGYKGHRNANKVVLDGLKSLEYRGYDSWGIANKTGIINVLKNTGKIGEIDKIELPESDTAIGHTRWATHGGVTKENAHPHVSNNNNISAVHTGIIENFQELRGFLKENGFRFSSETDTEIIPNFIEYFMKLGDDFKEAFRKTLLKIDGSYAIVAMYNDSEQILFGRHGSPLVLGVGEREFFVASDVPAFLQHTTKVIYLDDGEFGSINKGIDIFDLNGNEKEKEHKEINWTIEQAQKGDYAHFMMKEIHEQKFTIKKAIEQDTELIKKVTDMINNACGVFFVGCGTSYHACVSAGYEFSEIAKKHVNIVIASEFRNYEGFLKDETLVVAVSQSGETADVLDAVRIAKKHGVKVISIVNVTGSTLTRLSDETIMMNAGPEICVLSTKSYTSQLAVLLLLAYSCAGRYKEGREIIEKTSSYVGEIISENLEKLKKLAELTAKQKDYFLIGRDLAYPSALEGALKIKEVSYIHAEGFAGAELKHGTIALIDEKVPVVVLATEKTKKLILSNATEIKSRGGHIIGIGSEENELYDDFIHIPDVKQANPILMIIPIQILSYYLALERGCDPDKPRNLAKSVTVK
ncbi:glutamine--fructose-6-phosphate transaminase (isomerizing) [Candidatus Woesearchaeota archaeon]|nr:glutamine--fructose-6-phosphate transaminase (isomerizing) [Candidatus Woesearchaeota archaeon]